MKQPQFVSIRPASLDDTQVLFQWRNDEETRLQSHNSNVVDFDRHVQWLSDLLLNPKRRLYIAERRGIPVGTVRLDPQDDNNVEISYTVAPEFRKQGLGQAMVRQVIQACYSGPLIASVKQGNIASRRILEKAGFHLATEDNGVLWYRREACHG